MISHHIFPAEYQRRVTMINEFFQYKSEPAIRKFCFEIRNVSID